MGIVWFWVCGGVVCHFFKEVSDSLVFQAGYFGREHTSHLNGRTNIFYGISCRTQAHEKSIQLAG